MITATNACFSEKSGGTRMKSFSFAMIAFVNMLENGGAVLRVKRAVVSGRQCVEHVLDHEFNLGPGSRPLPPLQNEQLFDPVQQFTDNLIDLGAMDGAQLRGGARRSPAPPTRPTWS